MKVEVEVDSECRPCHLLACIKDSLNLSEEESRQLAKLDVEGDPDKIVDYLAEIRDGEKLKKALSECKLY